MTGYAINDRNIIAVWEDGRTRRWELAATVKGQAGTEVLVERLTAVSELLWARAEFLGDRERLVAIAKSALRRNGSATPNRRRAKTPQQVWDQLTQDGLHEKLLGLNDELDHLPDAVRTALRAEVIVEIDAVYIWAAGGMDREGRGGQRPEPVDLRFDSLGLLNVLRDLEQRGVTHLQLNSITRMVLELMLVTCALRVIVGEGAESAVRDLVDKCAPELGGRQRAVLVNAIDLVDNYRDPVVVARNMLDHGTDELLGLVEVHPLLVTLGRIRHGLFTPTPSPWVRSQLADAGSTAVAAEQLTLSRVAAETRQLLDNIGAGGRAEVDRTGLREVDPSAGCYSTSCSCPESTAMVSVGPLAA